MQAVILAAGEGRRMQPLTLVRPKPLVQICGMPIIEHVTRSLPKSVDELIIVVKYKGEQIVEFCGTAFCDLPVHYVWQGNDRGTAAALRDARLKLRDHFLVVLADDLLERRDLEQLIEYEHGVLAARHSEPTRFGVISLKEDGTLANIDENPPIPKSNLVSTGVMRLTKRIFNYSLVEKNGELILPPMVTALAQEIPVKVVVASFWHPVGRPDDIQ